MGNQEESQRERGLNLVDREIVGTMVKTGIRRDIENFRWIGTWKHSIMPGTIDAI